METIDDHTDETIIDRPDGGKVIILKRTPQIYRQCQGRLKTKIKNMTWWFVGKRTLLKWMDDIEREVRAEAIEKQVRG